MKKIFAILALAISGTAFAADYLSVDVDNVTGRKGASNSTAQYIRAGKEIGGIQFGLQGRTAQLANNGGTASSLELTAGSNLGGFTPYVGIGHDNGLNGVNPFNYGLVGGQYGTKVGPGFALAGIKTRVGSTESNMTHQTLAYGTYSVPVAKQVSVNLNVSRSYQDIKENAVGLGLGIAF
jgi:hypothetical protein